MFNCIRAVTDFVDNVCSVVKEKAEEELEKFKEKVKETFGVN